jgi:hypothetical protein
MNWYDDNELHYLDEKSQWVEEVEVILDGKIPSEYEYQFYRYFEEGYTPEEAVECYNVEINLEFEQFWGIE